MANPSYPIRVLNAMGNGANSLVYHVAIESLLQFCNKMFEFSAKFCFDFPRLAIDAGSELDKGDDRRSCFQVRSQCLAFIWISGFEN